MSYNEREKENEQLVKDELAYQKWLKERLKDPEFRAAYETPDEDLDDAMKERGLE